MECRILLILLLFAISAKITELKKFSCSESFMDTKCTITDVATQDTIFLSDYGSSLYGYFQKNNLIILNSKMNNIPPISTDSYNVNILYLNCVGCGLPDITTHSFSQLKNLKTLNISFGTYENLKKNLFNQMPSLTHLNVSHGAIVEIHHSAFSNSANLQYLDLSFNNLTKITSNTFSSLRRLWSLSLSYNKIKILEEDLFIDNTELNYVYLDHNEIIKIEGAMFSQQHICGDMTLAYNELTVLDTSNVGTINVWADHNKLKELYISSNVQYLSVYDNYIENVTCDEKGSVINILNMKNNSLTELGCIGSLSKLTYLSLSYNNIGKLSPCSFSTLTELKTLFLGSANISKLDYGVFSHQSNLEELDISYNHLGKIALEMLLDAKDLQKLYIDGNEITEFAYSDLTTAFPSLVIVGIGDNNFNCTFLAQAIKEMNRNNIQATMYSGKKVKDSNNVNGIGCHVKSERSSPSWIPSVTMNDTEDVELYVKLDAVIQQVETLTKTKEDIDKTFTKLSDDNVALKQQIFNISNDILSNKAEILKLELTRIINNSTNSSNTMLWTLINQLNNITLGKQQVSNRAQLQEINELKFQIDKNSYKLTDVLNKIEKLMKEETTTLHSSQTSNSISEYDLIRNLNIILITLIVAFCIYKGYKFVKNDVPRSGRYNTANVLHTNIEMNNSSTR